MSEMRPRDYKALEVFQDILRDVISNVDALKLCDNAKGYNALFLTGTTGKSGENRLCRIEGKSESRSLTLSLTFWEDATNRIRPRAKKVYSWDELYEHADEIRESVRNVLRG